MNSKTRILQMAHRAGEGHIASAFSILDILEVLYSDIKTKDDRFVLSKGHASLALYTVLAKHKFIDDKQLDMVCKFESSLGGHPARCRKIGIEASTGSLGHGFPIAVGMAMALKIKKITAKVFCLVGDGECNEGSIWEACLLASHHNLDNLVCIIDYNHSTDRAVKLEDLSEKFKSFGFTVVTTDGHNHLSLRKALSCDNFGKPLVIIANTIKGKGCVVMEGNPEWHHKVPTDSEMEVMTRELECESN